DITVIRKESGADQPQRHSSVRLWILLRQLSCDRTQILRALLGRHAWFQSAKHRHRDGCPVLQELLPPVHERYPVVRPVKLLRAVELRRSHADYRIGIS